MTDLVGQYLGRFYLAERLGEGGMATVYKGYDTRLERDVAVKIIRSAAFPAETLDQVLKRFEREAKSLAKLSHPNIVKVYDYGEHDGSPYLVMEYLPGGTLKKFIGKPIPWQDAVHLLLPIARGVAYAHQRGILHRDIKPANILITDGGEPMLSDFGIAKLFEGEQTTVLTGSGMAVGTPEYMAPEQWTGTTSPQSDLYSLGIVLYEMVTGRKPYVADTPAAILLKQATEPLPSPRKFAADLPEALEFILIKVLAREPENRYENVNAFIQSLEELLVSTPVIQTQLSPKVEEPPRENFLPSIPTQVALRDDGSSTIPVEKPVTRHDSDSHPAMSPPQARAPSRFSLKWIAAVFALVAIGSAVVVWILSPGMNAVPDVTTTFTPTVSPSKTITPTLTITPTRTRTSTPTSTPTPVYMEGISYLNQDFENMDVISGWSFRSDPVTGYPRKYWSIGVDTDGNHALMGDAPPNTVLGISTGSREWDNYVLEFRVKVIRDSVGKDNSSIGVGIRNSRDRNDKNITYSYGLGFGKSWNIGREICTTRGCTFTILANTAYKIIALDKWYQIRIEAYGPEIKVFVDGNRMLKVTDSTSLNGTIFLEAGSGAKVYFDDIRVAKLVRR